MQSPLYGKFDLRVSDHSVGPVFISPGSEIDVYTNKGAGAAVTFNLPPAKKGMRVMFVGQAAQNIVVDPDGTETITLAGTAQGAGVAITGTGAQNLVLGLVCLEDGKWKDYIQRGTWA